MEPQENSSQKSIFDTRNNESEESRSVPSSSPERISSTNTPGKSRKYPSEDTSETAWEAISANLLEASVEFWETISEDDRA